MTYSLENLELLWATYEFHSKYISDLESEHISYIKGLQNSEEIPIKKNIDCCNKLIKGYQKNIESVDDLICAYTYFNLNGIRVPIEREIDIESLKNLKDLSVKLIKELFLYKSRISP